MKPCGNEKHKCTKNVGNTSRAFASLWPALTIVSRTFRCLVRDLFFGSAACASSALVIVHNASYRTAQCAKLCFKNFDEYTIILVVPGMMIFGRP